LTLLSKLRTGINNPRRAAQKCNRLFAATVLHYLRPPVNIFNEDWDNLLILDACRYDLLQQDDVPDGSFEYRWSGGSNSYSFLEYNISNRRLDDVVWVTANPWVSEFSDRIFEVKNVWDSGWDDEHQTVLPETMTEAAVRAADEFPNKRLVVHFMQPHYPFIGPTGQQELPDHRTFTGDGMISERDESDTDIWSYLEAGQISQEVAWKAYRENLERALPAVDEIRKSITGKTVVTADHGNEFGGWNFPVPQQLYGHPYGYRTKGLVKVPWVVFEDGGRRTIESGHIESRESPNPEDISDKLAALGYVEQ